MRDDPSQGRSLNHLLSRNCAKTNQKNINRASLFFISSDSNHHQEQIIKNCVLIVLKEELKMAPNEVSLTMPIPDNVSAPTQNIQAQRKRPIKMIVVKYFEDTDKYAKIVPRPAFHILRRRLEEESQKGSSTPPRPPTKEEAENLAIVFGKDLTGMIMRDQADWLATYNPITSIMLYNEKQNK